MGSSSSHLGSTSSPPIRTKVNRTKQRLASFICGASSSSQSSQREDCAAGSVLNSADNCQQKANKSSNPTNDSISTFSVGTGFSSYSSSRSGTAASSESSTINSECISIHEDPRAESSSKRKCSSEGDGVVPHGISAESKRYQRRLPDSVNPSSTRKLEQISDTSDTHNDDSNNDMPQTSSEISSPAALQHEELEQPAALEEVTEINGSQSSDSAPLPDVSVHSITSQSRGDETIHGVPSGLELFVSDRTEVRPGPEGSLLHVDVVSISSNLLPNINNETSTREARRNSRRMFRDAFSSRSSRRHADFPAILFATEDSSLMGSHRRWLLDIGDDFFDDREDAEPWRFGRRSRFTNDRRRNSRSEFWDRLRGTATEHSHRTSCPLDLHPDGLCTCELDEEASALSSISRIILLAEALFEVLDEIHRQPDSLSLSMLSIPAPESVVDALPLKTYEKPSAIDHGDDVDQCYICLVEYEKGDKIRVLPCQHTYHMPCVDKWLKEIHGICPLCRGDVRGGAIEVAASSSSSDAVLT
ncbi:E3 ubiquitin-protein ligase RNF13 [Bienertia sinuspersici]